MRATELLLEFYDPEGDRSIKAELSDTRRARLSIRHLNKIRRMRDIEAEDRKAHLIRIKQIYNDPTMGGDAGI